MKRDAYWTIFRDGKQVTVWDEVADKPIKRYSKIFETEEAAEQYIAEFLEKYKPKIAILDRI